MESHADNETALSDFKEDKLEPAPVLLSVSGSSDNECAERLKAALAELDSEKQACKEAEKAKAELESWLARLNLVYQQAIRHKDEALRLKDVVTRQLADAVDARDDALKQRDEMQLQRDEIMRQKEEALKIRDTAKAESEAAARLLVTGSDNITSMASGIMAFSAGLPRTTNYTGLAAIAYGFAKRVEEVVGEVLRQRESALKGRNDMHSQIEQHNIQTAIEVSELKASISNLKEEMRKKGDECERWQKLAAEKDSQNLQIDQSMLKKSNVTTKDADLSTKRMVDAESRAKLLELELQKHNEMFVKQFQMLFRTSESLPQLSQALALDIEVNDLRQKVLELEKSLAETRSEAYKLRLLSNTQAKDLSEKAASVEELEQKASDLDIEVSDLRQKILELEKSLAETRLEADKLRFLSNTQAKDLSEKAAYVEEVEQKAAALDIEVNDLGQKVLELEKSLDETRSEADKLRFLSNTHAKDLSEKAAYVEEVEQKASALDIDVNDLRQKVLELEKSLQASALNIEVNDPRQKVLELEKSLAETRSEISARQEEVVRWKDAASDEAKKAEKLNEEEIIARGRRCMLLFF
ncbi:hypothetical protein O6H91_01G144800 [Diphasiastrum complanatum]|uniref:Uncharacterized protein n=1 Tax=Diphasiastrum complanatum TaxID=34168 RepID=A0ACC2EWY7_DIPCM|nr:hypothetical protein O6H91_01G144800 [Diphasiastrum complanatum]